MATKVKPIRLNITWTPQVWNVPTYTDTDTFAWWAASTASFGRFLSLWNCTTGQPISFPEATPYTYKTWDYFIVETVSSATPPVNYRPNGSSYTGTASSTTESDTVKAWDTYVYDWSLWLLQVNNANTYTAWTWININSSNQISNTWVTSFNWSTWAITYTAPVTSINTETWAVVLDADDISDSTTTNKFVTASDKTTWSWKQDALTLPSTPTSWHLVTWWWNNKTLVDGWAVPTWVPAVWTNGQVLTVVSWAAAWANPTWWSTTISVTLTTAWWSSSTQTVTATWVTSSNTVIVSPAPASIADYVDWWVYCSAQGTNSLTFTCDTTPSNDITVNVVILN